MNFRCRRRMLVAAASVAIGISGAQAQEVFCGLGPPPGSPDFDAYHQRVDRHRAELGYQFVCESSLRRFNYASQAKPLGEASKRLAFMPVSLDTTPFARFESLGGLPDHSGDRGASSLHRTFKTPQGRVVDLWEWDLSVDGAQVFLIKDLQTERVNGAPAQLVVLQAPGGGPAASILYWTTNRRRYELTIDANVRTTAIKPTLLELAQSVPAVVAGPEPSRCVIPENAAMGDPDPCVANPPFER